jgi:hypothetical protein
MLHRTRHLFIRQQTAVINSIRAHLAEFGIVALVGRKGVTELLHVVADPGDKRVPEVAPSCLGRGVPRDRGYGIPLVQRGAAIERWLSAALQNSFANIPVSRSIPMPLL